MAWLALERSWSDSLCTSTWSVIVSLPGIRKVEKDKFICTRQEKKKNRSNSKTGYDILVNEYDCEVQEMYTVQDHPPSPNDSLLLPPLDSLHKAHVRNQELSQPGDSRPVKPPCQRAISNQMMKKWEPWDTNTWKSNNSRMLQQFAFHTQQITKTTSTQDLVPRPLSNHDHPSVLPFEMYSIEPGEPPSWSLCWNPLGFLSHVMRRRQISTRLFRRSFADMQSQVRVFTGARLGSVPFWRHCRFGGSQS
jgi:hypothetical protein